MRDLKATLAVALLASCLSGVAFSANLQRLIDDAAPESTIDVPAGTYEPITLTKPVKLVARNGAVIDGGGHGDVITIAAADCEIHRFVIRGSGDSLDHESTGIRVLAPRARIENNVLEDVLFGMDLKVAPDSIIRANRITSKHLDTARQGDPIRLWRSNNCIIENNTIEHGRDVLLWYSDHVTVRKNVSRHNRYGFHMMYASDVILEDNQITGNSVGIYLMYGRKFEIHRNQLSQNRGPSGYGIGLKEIDTYSVSDNVVDGNRVGIYIDGSPYTRKNTATFERNTFACNDIGMALLPSVKGNTIWNNNFIDNIEQIAVLGRGGVSANTYAVNGRGNFWSDYTGYDRNHDGVGDMTYQSNKLFESLVDRDPKLRLMLFSPAHDAIEFIARAMPAVRPQPKFADPSPLMQPVAAHLARSASQNPWPMLGLATALLGVAGVAWLSARKGLS